MCGICGILNGSPDAPPQPALIRAMTESIVHRGPDDYGFHTDGPLAMGMRRLSIIDVEGGAQPMSSEDGTVTTVFNGEIYNFRELRRDLEARGHVFSNRSDTEVVVHGYEQWGLGVLSRLNGMYGLAIWDATRRQLLLARDPYGVKPLYYYWDGQRLLFGSEVRCILCDRDVPRDVDETMLEAFLSLTYVPSPFTAYRGIRRLPPGWALHAQPGEEPSLRRFWRSVPSAQVDGDEEALVERLRYLIERAVERQMVADVPVGALLSGGVDSGITTAVMSRVSSEPIDTFSVGFSGEYGFDELDAARDQARRIGSRHHEMKIDAEEYARFLPESVWYLEEPLAMGSTLAYYRVCQLARQHVKVVLTGQGADEPFAGYPRHLGARYGQMYRRLPARSRVALRKALSKVSGLERLRRAADSLDANPGTDRLLAIWRITDRDMSQRLLADGIGESSAVWDVVEEWRRDVSALDELNQMTYVDSRLSLADNLLIYGDKMSMATSLEARVPLLDLELMRFVEALPARYKIRGRVQKYLLKRAAEEWLPEAVLKAKKIGFAVPLDAWFRGDMRRPFEDLVLDRGSACTRYFQRETLIEMLSLHCAQRRDFSRTFLSLMVFEYWYQQFIRPSTLPFQLR